MNIHSKLISGLTVATLAAVSLCPSARATIIGFETAATGKFSGSVTESGYTYTTASGDLYVNYSGDPGDCMQGYGAGGGGVLDVTSATAGLFLYGGLDYSAYSNAGSGSQTLLATGYLNGAAVGTATYTLTNTTTFNPYANWTEEGASTLGLLPINDLKVTLNGSVTTTVYTYQSIDNLILNSAPVPEPGEWMLVVTGCGLLGAIWHRRSTGVPLVPRGRAFLCRTLCRCGA